VYGPEERVHLDDESVIEDTSSDYDANNEEEEDDDLITWVGYWMGVVMVLFVFVAMVVTSIGSSMVRMQEEIDWSDPDEVDDEEEEDR